MLGITNPAELEVVLREYPGKPGPVLTDTWCVPESTLVLKVFVLPSISFKDWLQSVVVTCL
jgi:hypothetical protein